MSTGHCDRQRGADIYARRAARRTETSALPLIQAMLQRNVGGSTLASRPRLKRGLELQVIQAEHVGSNRLLIRADNLNRELMLTRSQLLDTE